jgi:hypothetical protein
MHEYNLINLIMNRLIKKTLVCDFRNNPKCALRQDFFCPTSALVRDDFSENQQFAAVQDLHQRGFSPQC